MQFLQSNPPKMYNYLVYAQPAGGAELDSLCQELTIHNESNLVKPVRSRRIKEAFKGSYRDMSIKYGISEVQVRNIINGKG